MRIEKITLIHLKVPLKRPFLSANGSVREKEFLLLKASSGNSVGWGEASPETVSFEELMLDYKRNLVPFALQMPFDAIDDFSHSLSVMKASPEARAGLEMAAGNLLSEHGNVASSEGAQSQEMRWIPIGRILETGEESEIALSLKSAVAAGQAPVVLRVNPGNIQTVVALLRTYGERIPIVLDAEGSFSGKNAESLRQLSGLPVQLLIDPLQGEQWDDIRPLKADWKIPIAVKNICTDILEVERICKSSFIDAVCIDPWRAGGPMTAARYLTVASENEKPAYIFSQLHLDIGTAETLILLSSYTRNQPIFTTIPEEIFGIKSVSDSVLHFKDNFARLPAASYIHFNGIENQFDRFRITEEEYW